MTTIEIAFSLGVFITRSPPGLLGLLMFIFKVVVGSEHACRILVIGKG